MRNSLKISAVMTLLAFSVVVGRSGAQTRLADAESSDQDYIAFSGRAEGAMRSELHDSKPLVEVYWQHFAPKDGVGYAIEKDIYLLGRFAWVTEPAIENLLGQSHTDEFINEQQLLDGTLSIVEADWKGLSPDRYEYKFVRRTFLGSVSCLVYDVKPLDSAGGGFTGRLYLEDRTWNIVRFTGESTRIDTQFASLRGTNSHFRVDSWRANVSPSLWVPAFSWVEEVPSLDSPDVPVWKAQVRFWSYKTNGPTTDPYVLVKIEDSPSVSDSNKQPSPQESMRHFEDEAEANLLARLTRANFLSPPGEVDRKCEQVLTNLIVPNKLMLAAPLHCRVLSLSRLDAFSVGRTIIVSRGLVDIVPSEAAFAMVLARELASHALGFRQVDAKFAFPDILNIPDAELLAKLKFRHTAGEHAEADKRAMEILEQSPYKNMMSDGGLFLETLNAHSKQLADLIQPSFGENLSDSSHVIMNHPMFRTVNILDESRPNQQAASQLGSKLLINVVTGGVEFFASEPLPALAVRERAEFAVMPFSPSLQYASGNAEVGKPANRSSVQRTSNRANPASQTKPSAGYKQTSLLTGGRMNSPTTAELPKTKGGELIGNPSAKESENHQTGEVLHGSFGKNAQYGSGWIDLPPTDFLKGDQLRLSVGGSARKILVRLLEDPRRADSPEGIIGIFPVPENRVVVVPVDTNRRGIRQLSVHGLPHPWDYDLGEGNGPATLNDAQVIRGNKK